MELKTLGVIATSAKENEHRLPLHPAQLAGIDEDLRAHMYLERGYGAQYGVSDAELENLVAGLRGRDELIAQCDIILLPKPVHSDVAELRDGQVLWGWPHAVQDPHLTQMSIDKRLTLIAWEEMNRWTDSGQFVVHVFHANNEMAGYASVLHAMTLRGTTGHYGRPLTAVVLGFGNAARGAITALGALGVQDITALTLRDVQAVASPMPAAPLKHLYRTEVDSLGTTVQTESGRVSAADFLSGHDIIVNCVLQNTDTPMMFVTNADLAQFNRGTLIVDVSCDAGMGFEFACPTTFSEPTFTVGNGITYYAVDHSPSHLWDSATWMISEAVIPYLRVVMSGPDSWDADRTVRQAIEIRDGVVKNPRILSFQSRSDEYPHKRLSEDALHDPREVN